MLQKRYRTREKCIKSASASVVAQKAPIVIAGFIQKNFACYVEKWTRVQLFSKKKGSHKWDLILQRNKCCWKWILSRSSYETLILKRRYCAISQYWGWRKAPALPPSFQATSLFIFILRYPTPKAHRSKSIKLNTMQEMMLWRGLLPGQVTSTFPPACRVEEESSRHWKNCQMVWKLKHAPEDKWFHLKYPLSS